MLGNQKQPRCPPVRGSHENKAGSADEILAEPPQLAVSDTGLKERST